MSIPKKIHYLWMSEQKPATVESCLASWREHLKDSEIVEWNKTNFPYEDFLFAKEAYSKQKWAFVTDYFRLWVLDKFGGIYLDADVTLNAFRGCLLLAEGMAGSNLGDVNGDGKISVTDVMVLVKYILSHDDNNFIVDNADINGDGKISVTDVMVLVKRILQGNQSVSSIVINGAEGITLGGGGNGPARVKKNILWDEE